MKKLVLLLAIIVLVAVFVGGISATRGWKWHGTAAGGAPFGDPDGFTWDPRAAE